MDVKVLAIALLLPFLAGGSVSASSTSEEAPNPPVFIRGNVNLDGVVDITDSVLLINLFFTTVSGFSLECLDALDFDDNGYISILDAFRLHHFLFTGGPRPMPPFPLCGEDPTEDFLGCKSYKPCLKPPPEPDLVESGT